MVQLKYFGDSRDYFKYDLMTSIIEEMYLENYVFIPMLTNHRDDNEGNKLPKMIGGKSASLLSFISDCRSKSLCHWEQWLIKYVRNYKTIEPVDEVFFVDETRDEYWVSFAAHLKETNALIFLDPDTGLETGRKSYLRKMGREKYILNHEIEFLYGHLDPSSIIMIYQHLPNNKHIHETAVSKKLVQAKASNQDAFVCAYREDDLAFLFIVRNGGVFNRLCACLTRYHARSEHRYKSLHLTPNERLHSDGAYSLRLSAPGEVITVEHENLRGAQSLKLDATSQAESIKSGSTDHA